MPSARIHTDYIGLTALILVALSWILFGLIFLLRRKPAQAKEAKRDSAARWGMVLQGCGFGLVWSMRRSYWWPISGWLAAEIILAALAVVLAYASNWFCYWAVQTLGKQWTYAARVIEGHELITQGPYAVVRNPIYLGMFGLMVATGLVLDIWWALGLAVILFLIGNQIRVRAEEKLLREAFGPKFDEYAQRVPAFLPRAL
jgi:protein-S-isoprenylcysteine O-methyltransferase Ste14